MAGNIVRFDPFEDLTRLQREMNRVFDDAYRNPSGLAQNGKQSSVNAWAPAVDIKEDENAIVLTAEIPGVKQEDIDIELHGDTLTLRGERKHEQKESKQGYVRIERAYGSFQRSFTLNTPVNADQISAAFKDGLLTVTVPKSEATKPKKVAVTTA